MSASFLSLWLALQTPALVAEDTARPGVVILLAKEVAYQKAAGEEVTLEGVIERTPTDGRAEPAERFNAFRLSYTGADGKPALRELHVPGKAYLLASHVGKKVRVVGKLIDTKAGGKEYHEVWPARLEPLTGALAESPGADGIYARCYWLPESARQLGARQFVIRTGEQLAKAMRVTGPTADMAATTLMARKLNIPGIDWKKQMLICVSAGLKGASVEGLAIRRVAVHDGTLRVTYRLVPAKDEGIGFGYPAQTVLVDRFDAAVRFEQEAAVPAKQE